jgi:hypothetical protein
VAAAAIAVVSCVVSSTATGTSAVSSARTSSGVSVPMTVPLSVVTRRAQGASLAERSTRRHGQAAGIATGAEDGQPRPAVVALSR